MTNPSLSTHTLNIPPLILCSSLCAQSDCIPSPPPPLHPHSLISTVLQHLNISPLSADVTALLSSPPLASLDPLSALFNQNNLTRLSSAQYTFWAAYALWQRSLLIDAHPAEGVAAELFGALVENYHDWIRTHYSKREKCMFQSCHADGQENSAGLDGCRPTINSVMFGEAAALSYLSQAMGNKTMQRWFDVEKRRWQRVLTSRLWSHERSFFMNLATPPPRSLHEEIKRYSRMGRAREVSSLLQAEQSDLSSRSTPSSSAACLHLPPSGPKPSRLHPACVSSSSSFTTTTTISRISSSSFTNTNTIPPLSSSCFNNTTTIPSYSPTTFPPHSQGLFPPHPQ